MARLASRSNITPIGPADKLLDADITARIAAAEASGLRLTAQGLRREAARREKAQKEAENAN